MLKKQIVIAMTSMLLLVGCSNEVEQEASEPVKTTEQNISNDVEENKSTTSDTNSTNEESVASEEETSKKTGGNISESSEITINNDVIMDDIEKEDIFTYYNSIAPERKEPSNSIETVAKEESALTFEVDSDGGSIYLPTYEDNEKIFEESSYTVKLSELEEKGIASYVEEPITSGVLVVLEMSLLEEQYPAISYSLKDGDNEYSLMLVEEDPSLGLILIENSQISLENISNSFIMIMK